MRLEDLKYHICAPYGLINDPNGLIYFKEKYHVFFQWNQKGVVHKNKSWGHVVSTDMTHWEQLPPALEPIDWFDKDGVYSGSAIVYNDELYLFYTGNVKDEQGNRLTYQCLATSSDGIHFIKHGVLFEYPKGYTAHVRDPKVWFDYESGKWHMVLGAQLENETGDTILYTSSNLKDWEFVGSILQFDKPLGYMWECPDIAFLKDENGNNRDVFIFSPQGLQPKGYEYHNIHQTCYVLGEFNAGKFIPRHDMVELDRGFEFYAPQTFIAPDDRVIQYGWMGMMEVEKEETMPTIQDGWIHHLSVPRVLRVKDEQVYQYPVEELEKLRGDKQSVVVNGYFEMTLQSFASDILFEEISQGNFDIVIRGEVRITYNSNKKLFSVERTNWANGQREIRQCVLKQDVTSMRLLLEKTSMELFINKGQEVFSLRYFAEESNQKMIVNMNATVDIYGMA